MEKPAACLPEVAAAGVFEGDGMPVPEAAPMASTSNTAADAPTHEVPVCLFNATLP